jgi:uroporphyrinogen-III decarboxylase
MLEIIPDLIQCGVNIVNPQIRANSLRGLEKVAKGKVCIRLDLDRQLFPFATPEQVKAHIKEAVDRLNLPQGGLMLSASCLPDIPLENIQAICETFEELGGPSV